MPFPAQLGIPADVMDIVRTLEHAGHEAWCVGGAIRDTLLGETNTDFDVASSATPDQVQRLFAHTVPIGERYGTVAVRTRRRHHEITTFRRDVTTDGRHAVVEYGVSLDEDLARRDFTINAIAYHPLRHEWRDPFHGSADMERRLVRAVGEPARRFEEDYLRILRAIRFAARFDFEIERATWEAACAAAPGLKHLSAERVREEWFKSLRSARSLEVLLRLWWRVGAANVWLPELIRETPGDPAPRASGTEPHHAFVSRRHAREAILPAITGDRGAAQPRDPILLTILFTLDPIAVLHRLKASNAEIARAASILAGAPEPSGLTPLAVRRWMAAVNGAADDLSTLWELRHGARPMWDTIMRGIRERGEPLNRAALAIDGSDLQAIGIPPGPALGGILDQLVALVVDDPSLNTAEALLARARTLA